MKFQTHNQKSINTNGTSFIGYLDATYDVLRGLFGEPHSSDGYKTDAQWDIEFENGVVATIYNYKNGQNYSGSNGSPKEKIVDWNIGGKPNTNVLELVGSVLRGAE